MTIIIRTKYVFEITAFIYYFIIPIFLNNSTFGERFLNIQVVDEKENRNVVRLFLRRFIFVIGYIIIPFSISSYIINVNIDIELKEIIGLIYLGILLLFYAITGLKYFFTNKQLLYEKFSKTKLVSTIK